MDTESFDSADDLDIPGFEPPTAKSLPNADVEQLREIIKTYEDDVYKTQSRCVQMRDQIKRLSRELSEAEFENQKKRGTLAYLQRLVDELDMTELLACEEDSLLELDALGYPLAQPSAGLSGVVGSGTLPSVSMEPKAPRRNKRK